ncbi:MAG: 16S rRNA (uracil(1498)-N(3))-methyltransferase [Planctomycetaceae bacterium]|nr:16S rRNA (uracil(1498)-N(3))-methyltransferase [Planctomycetaceae bacterium]
MTRPQSARPESPVERFFLPQPLQLATVEQTTVELAGSEAHHLLHVLRAKVGDRVGLFNGQGGEAIAELVNHRKRAAELRILDVWTTPAESNELILATALPKGDRARWLVEKATELGVTRIIPMRTTRSVVEPGEGKMDKLTQAAIAACKQCGRSRLPRLDPLTPLNDALREFSAARPTHLLLLADPRAKNSLGQLFASLDDARNSVIAWIGPEGGFTTEEHSAAIAAGATPVRLGSHILRIETAALAISAAWELRNSNKKRTDAV